MSLETPSRKHLLPLLRLNDSLRELAHLENDIPITSIVCVGDQSHGKTSVIEALSGINLPRGEGIKTRVPLVLKLRNLDETGEDFTDTSLKEEGYALIKCGYEDDTMRKRIPLMETAAWVDNYTVKLAGQDSEKNIVDEEIHLTVYRKDQDDLTLIDLPGMTRVATHGQPSNIESTIMLMYERYMEPEETVLLNVVSAMVDFTTSKSLSMSRDLDPLGRRTMVCVTKVDQHTDKGIHQKVININQEMGIPDDHVFCVRNRSKIDNEQGVDLKSAREIEMKYFDSHRELRRLPASSKGVKALSTKLVILQFERIKSTLPRATRLIHSRIKELEAEVKYLGGDSLMNSESDYKAELQRLLKEFQSKLVDEYTGRYSLGMNSELQVSSSSFSGVSSPISSPRKLSSAAAKKHQLLIELSEGGILDNINLDAHRVMIDLMRRKKVKQSVESGKEDQSQKYAGFIDGPTTGTTIGSFYLRYAPSNGGLFLCIQDVPKHINSISTDIYFQVFEATRIHSTSSSSTIETSKDMNEIRNHQFEFTFERLNAWVGSGFNAFVKSVDIDEITSQSKHMIFKATVIVGGIQYDFNDDTNSFQSQSNDVFPSRSVSSARGQLLVQRGSDDGHLTSSSASTSAIISGGIGASKLLCARIHNLDSQFSMNLKKLYPDYYFFSEGFRVQLGAESLNRQVSNIFTDQRQPAIAILDNMRVKMTPLVKNYLEAMEIEMRNCMNRCIAWTFQPYPKVFTLVQATVNDLIDVQENIAMDKVLETLRIESKTVHTQSEYFGEVIDGLHRVLLATSPSQRQLRHGSDVVISKNTATHEKTTQSKSQVKPVLELSKSLEFLRSKVEKLKSEANQSSSYRKMLSLQCEIFAYWKVMIDRVIDYTQMAARFYIIDDLLELKVLLELQKVIDDASRKPENLEKGYCSLMAIDEHQMIMIEKRKKRINKLYEAEAAVKEAQTKQIGLELLDEE